MSPYSTWVRGPLARMKKIKKMKKKRARCPRTQEANPSTPPLRTVSAELVGKGFQLFNIPQRPAFSGLFLFFEKI